MSQDFLPRPKFPATHALLEKGVLYACYAAFAVLWIRRKFTHKAILAPRPMSLTRRRA